MLERFLKLKDCIKMASIKLNLVFDIDDNEIKLLEEVVVVLEPVKKMVLKLCENNSNLIVADILFSTLLPVLKSCDNSIAGELHFNLQNEIIKRRTDLSDVLMFLHTKSVHNSARLALGLEGITQKEIEEMLCQIIKNNKFESEQEPEKAVENEEETTRNDTPTNIKNFCANIDKLINKTMVIKPKPVISTSIEEQIESFCKTATKGPLISFVYDSLMQIRPSSVDCERAFSCAGYLCNKYRTNLRDDTFNGLCFLKSFFKTQ